MTRKGTYERGFGFWSFGVRCPGTALERSALALF